MLSIQQVTSDSYQKQILILPDGSTLTLVMRFAPLQYGWFFTSIVYRTFELNNLRIVNSPNMLHQYRNQIPFGLACFSSEMREPSLQQDFSSGNSKLYILTAAEVQEFTEFLSG